jgi:hypothetical protein
MPVDDDHSQALALADVDGDGDGDLIVGNYYQQNRLYLNDGYGTFADSTSTRMPPDADKTNAVAVGDIDGDSDLDLIFGNGDAGAGGQLNRLYLNDGTGSFTDATAASLPPDWDFTEAVALGDLDDDGDEDLIAGNAWSRAGPGLNRLYLNDGNGVFVDATVRLPVDVDDTLAVALGDLDGDGDLDLLTARQSPQDRLYLNELRQLDTPFLTIPGRDYVLEAYARYGVWRVVDVAIPWLSPGTSRTPVPPLGIFGLDPSLVVPLPAFIIPQPAGVQSLSIPVPGVPSLIGARVYAQVLLVQYPAQERLTSVTGDRIHGL